MSRIGKKPIDIPNGVEVKVENSVVHVKGPKGKLEQEVSSKIAVEVKDNTVVITRNGESGAHRSRHGLYRTLISNMIEGVTNGYRRSLDLVGIGYRVAQAGQDLNLSLGFSHPVVFKKVDGVDFELEIDNRAKINRIHVVGIDKQKVGQVAADIRAIRPPEPYKGKGIRYVGEHIVKKLGKAAKA